MKDDTGNPTHSFKDRVVAVALAAARELGFTRARLPVDRQPGQRRRRRGRPRGLGLRRADPLDLEQAKVLTTAVYGGTLLAVDGNYDDVNRLRPSGGRARGLGVRQRQRPAYYAEGSKTLGFEVAEQLGWRLPGQVVVPVASGSQLTKVDKGFHELGKLGLVEPTPYRVFGAQATGCSPVSKAFAEGHDVVAAGAARHDRQSLAIGNPADGPYVLDVARRTGGAVEPTSPTRRSSRASSCWPGPRACSPRRQAASPSRRRRS